MNTEKKAAAPLATGPNLAAPTSSSRRRLLQAGLGASPAILTIVSQPVRAGQCRSASAFASVSAAFAANGTTSAAPLQTCTGLSPTSWNTTATWPTTAPKNTLFSSVFSGSYSLQVKKGAAVVVISSPTFSEILASPSAGGGAYSDLARNMVAAYLNFKSLKTPAEVVTGVQLQAMWTAARNGSYRPTAGGALWTTADVNNWLTQTFGA